MTIVIDETSFEQTLNAIYSRVHIPFFHNHINVEELPTLIEYIREYTPNIPMFTHPCYNIVFEGTLFVFQVASSTGITLLFSDVLAEIQLDFSIEILADLVAVVAEHTKEQVSTFPVWTVESDAHTPCSRVICQTVPFVNLDFPTFDDYLSSLPKKNRYKVRSAIKQLETYGTQAVVHQKLPDNLLDWVVETTQSRWVSDLDEPDFVYEVAILQWLLAFNSSNAFFVQLVQDDETLAIGCFIQAKGFWSFNSFCQSDFIDGIGVQILACGVRHMIENPVEGCMRFSPTATYLPWQPAFHLYKHSVSNSERTAYLTLATPDSENSSAPFYDITSSSWVTNENT